MILVEFIWTAIQATGLLERKQPRKCGVDAQSLGVLQGVHGKANGFLDDFAHNCLRAYVYMKVGSDVQQYSDCYCLDYQETKRTLPIFAHCPA